MAVATEIGRATRRLRPALRELLIMIGCCLVGSVIVTLLIVAFDVSSRPVGSVAELISQADLLLSATSVLLASVVAVSTVFYTRATSKILKENRRTNDVHEAAAWHRRQHQQAEEVRRHAAELIGAGATLARAASELRHLLGWRAYLAYSRSNTRRLDSTNAMNAALEGASVAAARARMTGNPDLALLVETYLRLLEVLHAKTFNRADPTATLQHLGVASQDLELFAMGSDPD